MEIKKVSEKEYLQLRNLWCKVFDDEADYVDAVYDKLDAVGYVVVEDDKVISCLTLFEVGEFDGKTVDVSYAICTEPNMRGNSYASKLVEYVREEITRNGKLSLICPAEKSLVRFYQRLQYVPMFYADKSDNVIAYAELQEGILKDVPHIIMNSKFIEFVKNEIDADCRTSYVPTNSGGLVLGMIAGDYTASKKDYYLPYFGFPLE